MFRIPSRRRRFGDHGKWRASPPGTMRWRPSNATSRVSSVGAQSGRQLLVDPRRRRLAQMLIAENQDGAIAAVGPGAANGRRADRRTRCPNSVATQ